MKQFIRKDLRQGIYTATINKREIKITDREMFSTDDGDEIIFLMNDPEIVGAEKPLTKEELEEAPAPTTSPKFKFDKKRAKK